MYSVSFFLLVDWISTRDEGTSVSVVEEPSLPLQNNQGNGETNRSGESSVVYWTHIGLIFLLFAAYAATATPDVNEAHYLSKAKHYWNRAWCPRDFFLNTSDAHQVFYWSYGWTTLFLSLPATAWCGRLITWWLLAWGLRAAIGAAFQHVKWFEVLFCSAAFVGLLHSTHMAGEWVVGGVEAKGFAYTLVLFGIAALCKRQWWSVWLWFGGAAAFHVLVGGWAVIAAMICWIMCGNARPSVKATLLPLLIGGLLSLPGLMPGVMLTWGVESEILKDANQIYTYERLSHHLLPSRFNTWLVTRHLIAWGVWILLIPFATRFWNHVPQRLLGLLVLGSGLIAVSGCSLEYLFQEQRHTIAKILRYYWFRLADATLPLGITFASLEVGRMIANRLPAARDGVVVGLGLTVLWLYGFAVIEQRTDPRSRADRQLMRPGSNLEHSLEVTAAWIRTCKWIRENTPEESVFLTPRDQQTFRWYAERAEVANWKDVPQDATALVKWWKRQRAIYFSAVQSNGLTVINDRALRQLCRKYHARYLIIDRRRSFRRRPGFRRIFPTRRGPTDYYEVYDLDESS